MDDAKNQINEWNIGKKKTIHQSNKKKNKLKKKHTEKQGWCKQPLGHVGMLEGSNIHVIGVTEGEEKEQETGNLFEKIMKENFPNLIRK